MLYLGTVFFALLGGLAQTVTGFGTGVILMMYFSRIFSVYESPALTSSVSIVITFLLVHQYWKFIEWKKIVLPGILYIGSVLIAINVIGAINVTAIKLILGLFLIALAVYFFFFSKKVKLKGSLGECAFCSMFSGFTAGLFGIGGPLFALYFVTITDDRRAYAADMQTIFAANTVISLLMRITKGYYTAHLIPFTLLGFVGVALGKWLGDKVADKMDAELFKKVVYFFVGVSGLLTTIECL